MNGKSTHKYPCAFLFLISHLNEQGIPEFRDIRILSDSCPTTMGKEVYSKVLEVNGSSFQEGHDTITRYINEFPHFAWVKKLMTYEEVQKRQRQRDDNVCVSCGFSKNDTTVTSVLTITVPR